MIKAIKNVFSKVKKEIEKTGHNYSQQTSSGANNMSSIKLSGKIILLLLFLLFLDNQSKWSICK